jgi:hypothetical protein
MDTAQFLVWGVNAYSVGNACMLDPIENFSPRKALRKGVSLLATFPADAALPMSQRHKKDTALTDDISNFDNIKVCSAPLVEFLKKRQLKNVEYLPVTIHNHKGKVASKDYFILNPLPLQNALDVHASQPKYSNLVPTEVTTVEKLVIDPKRVEQDVKVFRLTAFSAPVIIESALAKEIEAAGFVGPSFISLERYGK